MKPRKLTGNCGIQLSFVFLSLPYQKYHFPIQPDPFDIWEGCTATQFGYPAAGSWISPHKWISSFWICSSSNTSTDRGCSYTQVWSYIYGSLYWAAVESLEQEIHNGHRHLWYPVMKNLAGPITVIMQLGLPGWMAAFLNMLESENWRWGMLSSA